MIRLPLRFTAAVLLFAAPGHSQTPAPAADAIIVAPGDAVTIDYDAEIARLKGGDVAVDLAGLRLASARRPGFSGYNSLDLRAVYALVEKNDFAAIQKMAEEHLAQEYLDPNAHFWLANACRKLGDIPCADFHLAVRNGIMRSIMNSGNGESPATAFVVIGTDEEYAIVRGAGMQARGQALHHDKGGVFDVLTVTDEQGKERDLWFRINAFFGSGPGGR